MATNMADYCPLNQAGHRFFVAYSKPISDFQPVQDGMCVNLHYNKIEYAYLSCNCGAIIKRPVQSN